MKRIHFEEIDSTNNYAKDRRKDKEDLIITAKRQTGGRGTKGRSFVSEEGGVYLTKLVFYDNFPADKVFLVMARTAVAVVIMAMVMYFDWGNPITILVGVMALKVAVYLQPFVHKVLEKRKKGGEKCGEIDGNICK